MLKFSDQSVMLFKGEAIPVWCPCGEIYQPELNSESSLCPRCDHHNKHDQTIALKQSWDEPL
jgi:hypothetical protein